jgi:hypothetical protein
LSLALTTISILLLAIHLLPLAVFNATHQDHQNTEHSSSTCQGGIPHSADASKIATGNGAGAAPFT